MSLSHRNRMKSDACAWFWSGDVVHTDLTPCYEEVRVLCNLQWIIQQQEIGIYGSYGKEGIGITDTR